MVLLIDSPLLYCILQGKSIIQGLTSSCYVNNCFLQCLAAKIYLLMNLSTWESNNRFRWEMVAIIILRYESSIYVNASTSTMNGLAKKYGEIIPYNSTIQIFIIPQQCAWILKKCILKSKAKCYDMLLFYRTAI